MKRIFLAIALVLSLVTFGFGQDVEGTSEKTINEKLGMPNLPGDFLVEFGWNFINNKPSDFNYDFWNSRSFNVAYLYEIPLAGKSSKFSFHPGLAISVESLGMGTNQTLGLNSGGDTEFISISGSDYGSVRKSLVRATYLDIPLEFRYSTRGYNNPKGFKVAVGGKFGYLVGAKTKIKHNQDGQTKIEKKKERFNISEFRYGIYGRVGFGWINVFYYQNLNSFFDTGKVVGGTDMSTSEVGLSFSLF
ncbi:outer membrane beta-barrel protein [Aureibacter tunicatorum]|uniref:Outer membrane protein beta-barrel domain-containing protein n=1 Tax=Aureibacter tunicatorum TaxID=866807 RepID=A0AAE3XKH8_9BACT|nr:outer membrane beta-barrel protein [Aureibacter tunicatorum]MDR6237674.1 hypothetical protein [Aureibacter tunicatorum]BDD02709.1 hypothetical protein AUTU_01920 [Aureibacter tunicatorum]